jgi:superfamily II DNA or RNA helicase
VNRIDRFIATCSGWAAFWDRLTAESPVLPGEAFERATQLYLQSHPEYRTQLRHVWRVPEEVPRRIRDRLRLPSSDEGIDLLAETNDGKFWAIQCKFRSDTKKPLTYRELSTFTSLAFVTCTDISLAVVAHTCSKPVRKHKYLGNATEIGLDRWLGLTDEDWRAIQAGITGKTVALTPRVPRPHQQQAIQAGQTHFSTESRGRLIMPCATGKSLTAFWIAQALDAKSIVVAVPSLALIRQSLLDWTREYLAHGEVPQWLVVCSDESTAKLDRDEFVGDTYDLGIPTTTKPKDIVPFLRKRTGRRIVFTTYQSSSTLAQAARQAGVTFDLAILDEAHKTVGVKAKAFATLLSDANIAVRRRLFMTATERVLSGESDEVFSMDNEAVYGKRFHQLTFKDAIAQAIISDYRILTITISDQTIHDLVTENRLIDLKGDETDAQALAAAVALRRAFEKHRITHAISFHRSIKAASEFCDRQAALDEAVAPKLTSLHVSSKKATGERAELMRQFVGEERALMTNARCLTEGVDVPAIDCVLFADPKQSVVDIVQAAGRALRPYPGKQYGYILLPLVVPAGMDVDAFAETTEFKRVARTITALSTQDERIAEQFRVVDHGRKPTGKVVEIEGDVAVGMDLEISAFADKISTRIWQRVGKANWRPFGEARHYVHSLGLKNHAGWNRFCTSARRPADLPTAPNLVYRDRGWTGMADWLGRPDFPRRNQTFRPFVEARRYARTLGLSSHADWSRFSKSGKRPLDVPGNPNKVYQHHGWKGLGDWLGTGTVAPKNKKFRPFEEARAYVHALRLRSTDEWREYGKSGQRPADIPAAPNENYEDHGWVGWGDWLGTGTLASSLRSYRPFNEARDFVRTLGLRSKTAWPEYARSGDKPADIPAAPDNHYKNNGWAGWGDWLGTGTLQTQMRTYLPFEEARTFVRGLGLHSANEWRAALKDGRIPANLPVTPYTVYRDTGWRSWGDWVGTGTIAPRQRRYRTFTEARAFARSLTLKSGNEWAAFCKSGKLPPDIPATCQRFYSRKGWISMGDWLGTGRVADQLKQFRPFIEARGFVRNLKFESGKYWQAYCRSGNRPPDIPSDPARVYREQGWAGIGDWLGTDTNPKSKRTTG